VWRPPRGRVVSHDGVDQVRCVLGAQFPVGFILAPAPNFIRVRTNLDHDFLDTQAGAPCPGLRSRQLRARAAADVVVTRALAYVVKPYMMSGTSECTITWLLDATTLAELGELGVEESSSCRIIRAQPCVIRDPLA